MVSRIYYDCNEAFIYWLWVHKIVIKCMLVKSISRTTVECVAGDDSHLPWCRLGTCKYLAWMVIAELRRVTTGQHCPLARATAGARAQGPGADPSRRRQGNTLKTTRHTTARPILQSVDTRVVG